MTFADIVSQVVQSSAASENFLTDGLWSCHYPEIPEILETIDHYLSEQGVQADDCVAVECHNSVPGALLLMVLLQKEQGFVLLPPSEKPGEASELKPIPRFCQHRLVIKSLRKEQTEQWSRQPSQFLAVERQATHLRQDLSEFPVETRGKLFLRTSGSMGPAKIVVHSQAKVLGNAGNCVRKYQFTVEDRVTIPVPIFHFYGFGAEFLPGLLVGASIDLQENTNLLKYLDRERRFQPTIVFITPNLCEMLLQGKKTPRYHKVIVVSGQRFREELFRAFDPLCCSRLVNQYGSTKMGAIAACSPDDPLEQRATTIGQPMAGVELRIDSLETSTGELHCRHPYGFIGYMDEAGNWLYRADEWHRTGDVARTHEGRIEVVGRADNSVNRSGYLVFLADIERMIEKLDQVAQVTVIATQREERIQGQQIIALCVPKDRKSVV